MKKHIVIFFLIAIAIVELGSIPFQIGYLSQTKDLTFHGTYIDTADYAVHISMIQAGKLGEWAYQMRFTSEEHTPAFVRLFYIFLGHISRWFNLEVETVFHLARWLFGFTALWAIYLLLQKIFENQTKFVYFSFFLCALGGGIGWLQIILGAPLEPISPIDFWLIDAYFLFSISLFPSFSFTLTSMTLSLYLFLMFLETQKKNYILFISILAVTTQLFNPIAFIVVDFAMAGATLFTWWKNQKIEIKHTYALGFIAIAQTPLLLYNLFILTSDPIWSQFTTQNETLSPSPIFYFLGFLPLWIFAIVGIFQSIREKNSMMGALSTWVISGFALAYLPVLIQRRFLLGITIPLGILAIYGFKTLIKNLPASANQIKKRENLFLFGYVVIASISSIFLILSSSLYVASRPAQLFYTSDIKNAAEWLNINASPNDFVLASMETSQVLAQNTFLKMYFGHEMETLYFQNKEALVNAYFQGAIGDDWLSQTTIKWIVYSPYEKEIIDIFTPSNRLVITYQNDTVSIYKVSE